MTKADKKRRSERGIPQDGTFATGDKKTSRKARFFYVF